MRPGARIAAAIDILDQILAGEAAERALINWARRSRFAGSKDRAAVRDLVFDAVRCQRSYAWLGGANTGRGLMIGFLRYQQQTVDEMFSGEGHAPQRLSDLDPKGRPLNEAPDPVRLDMPDWLWPDLQHSLGTSLLPVLQAMRHRAPVFLRVNRLKAATETAVAILAADGITTRPHPLADTALEVLENARKITSSQAYLSGMVELQDAASQAVVDMAPRATRVLDYCAGGGGKSLAIAATGAKVFAHDAQPDRMRDLPTRAARAGADIDVVTRADIASLAPFDLVVCDVPCSGSGAWRRTPDAKWRLTAAKLQALCDLQTEILQTAQQWVTPGGCLAYFTCSLLRRENDDQVARFLREHPNWAQEKEAKFQPLDGSDGFFGAILRKALISA